MKYKIIIFIILINSLFIDVSAQKRSNKEILNSKNLKINLKSEQISFLLKKYKWERKYINDFKLFKNKIDSTSSKYVIEFKDDSKITFINNKKYSTNVNYSFDDLKKIYNIEVEYDSHVEDYFYKIVYIDNEFLVVKVYGWVNRFGKRKAKNLKQKLIFTAQKW